MRRLAPANAQRHGQVETRLPYVGIDQARGLFASQAAKAEWSEVLRAEKAANAHRARFGTPALFAQSIPSWNLEPDLAQQLRSTLSRTRTRP